MHAADPSDAGGPDTRSLSFLMTTDQEATIRADVQRVRSWPYLGGCASAASSTTSTPAA